MSRIKKNNGRPRSFAARPPRGPAVPDRRSRISAPDTTPLANEPEPSPESAATIDVDLSWRKRALIAAHQRWRDSELGRF